LELISSWKATTNTKLLNNDNNNTNVHQTILWLLDSAVTHFTHFILTQNPHTLQPGHA
jgi:hypothetical protein